MLEALRGSGARLPYTECDGSGICGKCRIRILSGDAGEISAEERRLLGPENLARGIRLACRACPQSDIKAEYCEAAGAARILEKYGEIRGTPSPAFTGRGEFGVAVDIGTTTIAAYLVAFAPGFGDPPKVIDSLSVLNSQRSRGADVISRIEHSGRPGGLAELAGMVRADIRSLGDRLLARTEANGSRAGKESLRAIAVVGNTTMLHLFAEADPSGIAAAPFTPVFTEARIAPASEFGLPYPDATLIMAPSIAAYAGADLVAAIRSAGLETRAKPSLVLDLGTNGEVALGDENGISCCATAAGPAFEGGAISCGTGSVEGAVDSVRWSGGEPRWTTIGGAEPLGLCGSGIIDAVACMIRAGLVDSGGALRAEWNPVGYPIVRSGDREFRLTQKDLRQIQLAKAAVAAGIEILLSERGVVPADIENVFLAGGFGAALNPESSAAIGLIPAPLTGKIEAIGNAAGHGAVRLLLFADELERMTSLARNCEYVDLSSYGAFAERFVDNLSFPAADGMIETLGGGKRWPT